MSACPQCRAAQVPHTAYCIDCGLDAAPPEERVARRLELAFLDAPSTASAAIAASAPTTAEPPPRSNAYVHLRSMLARLTERAEEDIGWVLDLGRLSIEVDVRPSQLARLEAALRGAGMEVRTVDAGSAALHASGSLRWSWAGHTRAKLGVTAAMGLGALAFGVPLVPAAALVTAGLLIRRAGRFVSPRLVSRGIALEELLDVPSRALLFEARATRKAAAAPAVIEALRGAIEQLAEMAWTLRADLAHLREPALGRLDRQVDALFHRTLSLASTATRDVEEGGAYRRAGASSTRGDAVRRLEELGQQLDGLRVDLGALVALALRDGAAPAAKRELGDFQLRIARALEVADAPVTIGEAR